MKRKCTSTCKLFLERLEDRTLPSAAFGSAFAFGSTGYDSVQAVATDAAGNVYAAGEFAGTVDLDPGAGQALLTSVGASTNTFVAKYAPDPTSGQLDLLWAKRMGNRGDAPNATMTEVAVDGGGNVFVADLFEGSADFGNVTLTSGGLMDAFVTKLGQDGTFQWAQQLGNNSGTQQEFPQGLTVDGDGNVYTTGRLGSSSSPTGYGAFLAKHDANGQLAWLKMVNGTTVGWAVRADAAGNVVMTGVYTGTVDADPGPGTYSLTSAGSQDVFLLKLSASGDFVWAGSMGGQGSDTGHDLAIDASGSIYLAGSFGPSTTQANDFDPGPGTLTLPNAGNSDAFVVKLDANRNLQWARSFGGSGGDAAWGIALDGTGNVYTTGNYSGTADFDPGSGAVPLTSAGSTDVFVSELSGAGDFLWAGGMGGAQLDVGYEVAVDASGNIYTGGVFSYYIGGPFAGQADFDPGAGIYNLTSTNGPTGAPSPDAFVSKLIPAAPGPALAVTGFPSLTTAGSAGAFTVTAKDASGITLTGYTGTVHFSSTDPQAVLPGDYTFTAADQGVHTVSATLKTAGLQSLAAADSVTPGMSGGEGSILVKPAAAARLVVSGPSSTHAGTAFSITITMLDAYGNVATGHTGTVHVTSSDSTAVLPANCTFTAADNGVHTFTGLKLKKKGTQTITFIDTLSNSIVGSLTINVT